jgi:hypothetical protein
MFSPMPLNALSRFAQQALLPAAVRRVVVRPSFWALTDRRAHATGMGHIGMSQGASLSFAAVLIIAALIFLAFGGHAYLTEERYARDGRVSTGTVLGDSRQVGRSSGSTTFETRYEFALPDGEVVRGENVIDAKFFQGARVEIEYLASEPAQSRIKAAGPAYRKRMWVFLGLGAAFLFVGLYLTAYNVRQR